MRKRLGLTLMAAMLAGACGGGNKAPTGPSPVGTTPGAPTGASATVTGSVQSASGSATTAASGGAALTGVTVSVVGTAISSAVDGAGRFTLMNVPAGTVQLQLTGGGANATVTLGTVEAFQILDVVLAVSGSTASVQSSVRSGSGEAQLEGRVESLPPTMPALTFKAAGRTVRTDASTRFTDGSLTRTFVDLQIGMRVHVKGSLSGETFTATRVELQSAQLVTVEVNGTIDGLTGSASAFQFNVGSTLVKGDGRTTILGHGPAAKTFADLKNGMKVEVKGTLGSGFLQAARIRIEEEEAKEVEGRISNLSGNASAFQFNVGSTLVKGDGRTTIRGEGNAPKTFGDLKNGLEVEVKGTLGSGFLQATRIEIEEEEEKEVEGRISNLSGNASAFQFNVGSTLVKGDGRTTIRGEGNAPKTFADLKNGLKVEVKGTLGTGFLQATRIEIEEEEEKEVEGRISNLSGNASAFQFNVGSTLVKGDGRTTIQGEGNAPKTFADLKNGLKVEVKGTLGSGFLQATRIEIEDEEEKEVEVEGTLGAVSGTCPTLSSSIGSTKFTTSSATKFEGASCSAFKAGARVEVEGIRKADGSVTATKLEKKK